MTTVFVFRRVAAIATTLCFVGAPLVLAQESQEAISEVAPAPEEAPVEASIEPEPEPAPETAPEPVPNVEGAEPASVLPAFDGDLEALSIIAAEEEWQREANAAPPPPPPAPETGVGIQATFNTQEAVGTGALESTENPETATSSEGDVVAALPAEDATSTEAVPVVLGNATTSTTSVPTAGGGAGSTTSTEEQSPEPVFIAGPASLEVIDGDLTEGQIVEPESIDVITVIEPEPVASSVVAKVEAEPEAEFTFALTGKQIPTKKMEASSERFSQGEGEIDTPLVPIIDNETGVMNIAGSCSDVYFVVLLFENERDYARDPRSYILNQAFPCENGQFSYSISELPYTLQSGTYYLLVGQQGVRGAWTPITSLTEITINNQH